MADPRPLYQRIAHELRDQIATGALAPGDRVPSTNELSAHYSVNPTTSAKALTALFEDGLVEKHRGLGMFVLKDAADKILAARHAAFTDDFLRPLLDEARALSISSDELIRLLRAERKRHK